MILTRTPLRVSLGGGGTDLPEYSTRHGGYWVSAAINRHVYVAVNDNFDPGLLLKYSQTERVAHAGEIIHPLLAKALIGRDQIEVSSMADVPAGTGLGSSGAFSVGLLRALWHRDRRIFDRAELAEAACDLDGLGKQDPYIATFGGVTAFELSRDGQVSARPVLMADETRRRLEDGLLLFYTGARRSASEEIAGHAPLEPEAKDQGRRAEIALANGDLDAFGRMLSEQWAAKLARHQSAFHVRVDEWLRVGRESGALGGKLVGAGGGGFLMFFADAKTTLRRSMADLGLREVSFGFDYGGSVLVCDD